MHRHLSHSTDQPEGSGISHVARTNALEHPQRSIPVTQIPDEDWEAVFGTSESHIPRKRINRNPIGRVPIPPLKDPDHGYLFEKNDFHIPRMNNNGNEWSEILPYKYHEPIHPTNRGRSINRNEIGSMPMSPPTQEDHESIFGKNDLQIPSMNIHPKKWSSILP